MAVFLLLPHVKLGNRCWRAEDAILLKNQEYWEINNLEVTNSGTTPGGVRRGVRLVADNYGDVHHIYVRGAQCSTKDAAPIHAGDVVILDAKIPPAIDLGKMIENSGGRDFFGVTVLQCGGVDRGAMEATACGTK